MGLVVVVVVAAGVLAWSARDDDGSASDRPATMTPHELDGQVQLAYEPLTNELLALDRSVDEAAVRAALLRTERSATTARGKVFALSDDPGTDDSLQIYAEAAELYGLHASIAAAALDSSDAALGDQIDALAGRVRVLADRVYDRGKIALVGAAVDSEGVVMDLVDEVPDFALAGQAAGPPLTPTAPVAPGSTGRRVDRPTSSEAAWRATVAGLQIPRVDEVAEALDASEAPTLSTIVDRYVGAEQALRAAPDPDGGRERNSLLRLALLIGADAFRSAESGLPVAGRALAAVSDELARLALSG